MQITSNEIFNIKYVQIYLTEEEIKYVVNNFVSGEIKDYQMSSLLMAIVINGMTDNEVIYLDEIEELKKISN